MNWKTNRRLQKNERSDRLKQWSRHKPSTTVGTASVSEFPDYCASSTATRAGYSADWTDKKVRVISPDAAVFIGTYSPTFSYNNGRPPRHYLNSVQRLLVERTETGWGISWMSFSNGPYEDLEG